MKQIKKLLTALLALCCVITMIPISTQAATVRISEKSKTITEGQKFTLKINGTSGKVTWSTSDKKIATVTSKGVVKGISKGKATITATVNKKKYTCKVTVRYKTTVKKSTILNQDGIKIVSNGLKETDTNYILSMITYNSSEYDYDICPYSYSVNGLMCGSNKYGFNSVDVPKDKKNIITVSIDKNWMKENNISYIKDIELQFWGYHDSYAYLQSGIITVKTNLYDSIKAYKPSGEKIYSDDLADVYYTKKENNSFSFCVKNKTDKDCVTFDNCSVNDWGYKITDYTYSLYDEVITPNSYDNYILTIDSTFLTDYNIKKIKTIEFDLSFGYNNNTEKIKLTL